MTPCAAQATNRKKFLLSGADHDSSRRDYAESEINNPEDDSTSEEPFGEARVDRWKRVDGPFGRRRQSENYVTEIRAARAIAPPPS